MKVLSHRSLVVLFVALAIGCGGGASESDQATEDGSLARPGETYFRNLRQLTFGGQNAEAYWAFDGSALVYQARTEGMGCDQIFLFDLESMESTLVSTGEGRTTCSYFYPDGERILYSSTHHRDAACPAEPDMSLGYVWPIYDTYDIFVSNLDGSGLERLTTEDGYDAEATISPVGDRIVFTSVRDGDLDLYSMNLDGSDVRRLTDRIGYDGGAFYSPDGTQIVWRAHYPETPEEIADYQRLLDQGLIRPGELDIWVMDADGSNKRKVTDLGGASFAPYWHPSGERILFSSNHEDPQGREFELYMVDLDGSNLVRLTHSPEFDGFPVFSPDGRWLVFGSNRNGQQPGETNLFLAEWVEP